MKSVLIIEDDCKTSKIIEGIINITFGESIKILKAENGKEALNIANNMSIDIFIFDIMLPDCDGIELAKEIRKSYPFNPFIIESSKGDGAYESKVLQEIQSFAFIKKTVSFPNVKMISAINYAIKFLENTNVGKLTLKQNNKLTSFMLQEIIYITRIKNQKKIIVFFYESNIKKVSLQEFSGYTLSTVLEKSKKGLLQCHKSFLVNPSMVKKINYDTITLKYDKMEIPIGETYKKKLILLMGG